MEFIVVPTNAKHAPSEGQETGYLWTDQWNDWFTYETLYYFTYFDHAGEKHEIGLVKIGQFDWEKKQRRPGIPERFERLSEEFFSLGQDIDYYKVLMEVTEDERIEIFEALRDTAYDEGPLCADHPRRRHDRVTDAVFWHAQNRDPISRGDPRRCRIYALQVFLPRRQDAGVVN